MADEDAAGGLDRDDARPLYVQLRDAVADRIASHTLLPGDALPTESELQQHYGVARSVVRQALAELADAGLIHRRRGRGGVVAATGDYRREVQRAGGLGEQMAAAGRSLRTEAGDLRRAEPPAAARDALGPGETWQIERLRLVGDEAVVLVRTWVPVAVLPSLTRERLAGTALHELMRENGHVPAGGRRHVQAVPADGWVAARLGIGTGEPVLLLEGVTRDAGGHGLEWFSTWHRPNTVFDLDARVDPPGDAPGPDVARLRELSDRLAVTVAALEAGCPAADRPGPGPA